MGEKVDIRPFQGRVWYLIRIRRDAPDAINSVPFRDFNSRVRMRLQLNLAPMGLAPALLLPQGSLHITRA